MTTPTLPPSVRLPLNRLYLEYTNRCNMACIFCPYPRQSRAKGSLSFEMCKRIVNEVREKKIASLIEVTGYGEPLMNPEWRKISEYIVASGIRLNLTTNGALLTESTSAELAALDLEDVIISLQTPDRASFALRRAALDFDTYRAQITRFIQIHSQMRSRSHVRLRLLNTAGTKHMSFPEEVTVLRTRGELIACTREWTKTICELTQHPYDEDRVAKGLSRIAAFRPTAIRVTRDVTLESYFCSDYWVFGTGSPSRFPTKVARCRAMTLENALVYHDGEVSLCCSDFDNYLNIGSLSKQTLMDALCSERAASLIDGFCRFRVKHSYCQTCLGGKSRLLSATKAVVASMYMLNLPEYREIDLS